LMRAVIYARYSSDLQREASIEDQVRICRERIRQQGGDVVHVYTDAAISGSRLQNRPGMQKLLSDSRLRPRKFDVVVAEALDRLSRDQEDIAAVFKRLGHVDVRIHTLSEGDITELHVGLKGTMNALFLKDLGQKVRRGQRGRAEAGRAAGGLSYGYRMIREIGPDGEIERGRREIDPVQAAVIRRIFEEYVAGRSPRAIATDLNREGIPSPRGGTWNASTINGHRQRLHGILQNPLYSGKMIYGRLTYRKDPESGAREPRLVESDKWVHIDVPEWRIVPAETWEKAQRMRARHSTHRPHQARRPRHLLSGLLRCGVCDGAYTMRSSDRLGCVAHREKGTCANNHTVLLTDLETRVLGGLRDRMLAPEIFAEFAEEYRRELKRLKASQTDGHESRAKRIVDVKARIDRIIEAIADGTASPTLKAKLSELEAERAHLEAAHGPAPEKRELPEIHPNLPQLYKRRVTDLQRVLTLNAADRDAAAEILRSLIMQIVVRPGKRRGETIVAVTGSIPAILEFAGNQPRPSAPERSVATVVPRGGIEPPTP
jgi:site-specific DNA recombinase